MLGIGLGGFASGLGSGYELGTKINKRMRERKDRENTATALAAGQSDYDAAVSAGDAQAGDPDGPMRYAAPRIVRAAQESGDTETVQNASDWLKNDKVRQASRHFANGMLAGQNGDIAGAVQSFVQAGSVQGYGEDIKISNPQQTPDGGVSVDATDSQGNKRSMVFKSPDDVLKFGAAYMNPESAFERWNAERKKNDWRRTLRGPGGGAYDDRLVQSESGGRTDIVNKFGYAGKRQFGAPRLAELGVYQPGESENLGRWSKTRKGARGKWSGTFNIPGHPEVKTLDDFLVNEEAQDAVGRLHEMQNDADITSRGLDKYLGTKIKGVEMTREGIQAMMHLGGRPHSKPTDAR